jgi:hypothetical protein
MNILNGVVNYSIMIIIYFSFKIMIFVSLKIEFEHVFKESISNKHKY